MTVKELKELLEDVPDDAVLIRLTGEYNGATSIVTKVNYQHHPSWGRMPKTILFD